MNGISTKSGTSHVFVHHKKCLVWTRPCSCYENVWRQVVAVITYCTWSVLSVVVMTCFLSLQSCVNIAYYVHGLNQTWAFVFRHFSISNHEISQTYILILHTCTKGKSVLSDSLLVICYHHNKHGVQDLVDFWRRGVEKWIVLIKNCFSIALLKYCHSLWQWVHSSHHLLYFY